MKTNSLLTVKKNIALVLSSGGAKGYAHIGAIKAIEEMGYAISSIAGTSMGSLVGGLYAAGKLDEAYAWLKSIDNWEIFRLTDIKNVSDTGIINGEYIFSELHKIIGDILIEDLNIPFCCVAADLSTGKEVVFKKGRLLDAIRASVSLPGFFKPYEIGNRRYIDGGVVNGLPINRIKRVKGDRVFAINLDTFGNSTSISVTKDVITSVFSQDVLSKYLKYLIAAFIPAGIVGKAVAVALAGVISRFWSFINGENFLTIILSAFYISLKQNKLNMVEREHPDIYINIDLKGYATHNFSDAEAIAYLGYNQVRQKLITL